MAESYEDHEDLAYMRYAEERKTTARKLIRRLCRLQPRGRLLDVGCATGDFLMVAKDIYTVEGLELSGWSVKIARQAGLTIHERTLAQMTNDGHYDIITLWGVIEHLDNPVREVRNLHRLLRPGGLVALWTGDICSVPSRLLGRRWWYIQGQHIQLFSRHSLRKLFTDNGFSTVSISLYPCVKQMHSISHSLARYPLIGSIAPKILTLPFINNKSLTLYIPGEMLGIFRKE
jgi:SAM-dependent methyltransferase